MIWKHKPLPDNRNGRPFCYCDLHFLLGPIPINQGEPRRIYDESWLTTQDVILAVILWPRVNAGKLEELVSRQQATKRGMRG